MGDATDQGHAAALTPAGDLEFRLLGPLEFRTGGQVVPIAGHRRRVVLLMLLLDPGRVITVDRLIRAIWDDASPRTAGTQVQICISQLRSMLAEVSDADLVRTYPAGYTIEVSGDCIDAVRFGRLVASGRAAAHGGDLATAAEHLRAALDLWRGETGAGVSSRLVQAAALRLNEERLVVLQEWFGLEFALGRHDVHIGELAELVAEYPLREKLHALFALALYRAGRQAEALAACRHARAVLVEDHGIDPGHELRRLERAILDNAPDLDGEVRGPALVVPRQLPAPPPHLVGRTETVAELAGFLAPPDRPDDEPRGVPVVSISGAAGVGKTALAIQLAHRVNQAFPDGQLYAHLRATDAVPLAPEQVLNQFLRALGVPPATLTGNLAEHAALYRSCLAGHRLLVVLDDATSGDQVRPLIPGDPGCALVVTSRQGLPGLSGARRIGLDVLDPATSLELLAHVIGETRVQAEPEAALALAEACGHLPLALQVAAAKLSVKSHWRVTQLVHRLADERRRLDELTLGDVGVRPSIAVSFRALRPPAARLLLLLGTLGATDFAGWVAGPLLDADLGKAADVFDELVEARLVEVQDGSGHQARYRLHDLTKIFARERLADEVPTAERRAAQHRLLCCWLFLAGEAHRRELGGDHLILHSEVTPWRLPPDVVAELLADPMRWLQSEHANLVTAVRLAAQLQYDDLCWDLAVTSVTLFETRSYHDPWRDTHEVALESVRRAGNRRGEAVLRYSRGGLALAELRLDDARDDLVPALAWFAEAGDAHGRGLTLRDLATIDRLRGGYEKSLARSAAARTDLRSAGDPVAEANVLRNMAQIHLERGRVDEAEACLREALAICAEVGVRRIEAQVRYRLGQALLAKRELADAEEAFQAVLRTAEAGGDLVGRSHALLGLGTVHLVRGRLHDAATDLSGAFEAARTAGDRLAEGQILLAFAELRRRTGDSAAAVTDLDRADAIFRATGAVEWQARAGEVRNRLPGQ